MSKFQQRAYWRALVKIHHTGENSTTRFALLSLSARVFRWFITACLKRAPAHSIGTELAQVLTQEMLRHGFSEKVRKN